MIRPQSLLVAHHGLGNPVLFLAHSLPHLPLITRSDHALDVRMRLMPKEDEGVWHATEAIEEREVEHVIVAKAKEVVEAGSSTMV